MDALPQVTDCMSTEKNRRISKVVSEMGRGLMRFVRARVSTREEAEDIMQDVWQQLVTTLDSGAVEQIGSWLYTVARNKLIDRYRKPQMPSIDALSAGADDVEFNLADFLLHEKTTPRTEHLRSHFWETLQQALAGLPEEQRQVFVWHELEDLPFLEIARITGENVNTLISRKRYAVLHLRKCLEPLREEFRSAQSQH